ncbi:hypothetical protein LSH36_119g08011 [Paralvinella palmiformis]|uniref:Uncharacterized protein n=1 Tax=Paralvinella palmiformis TaxID=53620 RepID=A0AAD9JY20_9ANNE|nr:hypothetical protein LSH36_119g08011 [Paralvinella palmiformis]
MECLMEWLILTLLALIRHTESRTGRGGGSASRCPEDDFSPPETKYKHPGYTWVNYMLYSLFGLITLAMVTYIVFIHVMRHVRSNNRRRAIELTQQNRPNSSRSDEVITSREIRIS